MYMGLLLTIIRLSFPTSTKLLVGMLRESAWIIQANDKIIIRDTDGCTV